MFTENIRSLQGKMGSTVKKAYILRTTINQKERIYQNKLDLTHATYENAYF